MPNLKLTLKAWPVIAAATIGLCFLTQSVAKLFGIDLPDQANIELVRKCFARALESPKYFGVAAFLCLQVLVIMPAIEEFLFRYLLFRLPTKKLSTTSHLSSLSSHLSSLSSHPSSLISYLLSLISSILFSAAHYLFQPWPDAAFIALAFFGLAQCWLYRKTEHIWCPMLNHALFNLTNLVLLFILPESV